jgi:translation initiation factor IF-3
LLPRRKKTLPPRREKQTEHRINRNILTPSIRLVGENIEPGIYDVRDALKMAEELELDLVEISPKAEPPVCRIIDYNKFLYDKKKKEREIKKKQVGNELKEIRFSPNTDEHDLAFKKKHAIKFLTEGNKVKIYVQFRGRAIMFKERGELLLLQFAQDLEPWGGLEAMPNLEGKKMIAYITPKKKA